MVPIVALCAAACLGVRARSSAPLGSVADGRILDSRPCPVPASYDRWITGVARATRQALARSGVEHQLDGRSIVPRADFDALRAAAASGRCVEVRYASGGLAVQGFVVRPEHDDGAAMPAVLYARGGNRDFAAIGTKQLVDLVRLAREGLIVVATQYRGSAGGPGRDEFGGSDVEDLMSLAPLARSLPDVDPNRLCLFGVSRGGMQACLAMKRRMPVRAAVISAGIVDLESMLEERPEMARVYRQTIPGFAADPRRALRVRSAVRWVDALRVPILLLHARQDTRVRVEDTLRLARLLEDNGIPRRVVVYDQDAHSLVLHRDRAIAEVSAWCRSPPAGAIARVQ